MQSGGRPAQIAKISLVALRFRPLPRGLNALGSHSGRLLGAAQPCYIFCTIHCRALDCRTKNNVFTFRTYLTTTHSQQHRHPTMLSYAWSFAKHVAYSADVGVLVPLTQARSPADAAERALHGGRHSALA